MQDDADGLLPLDVLLTTMRRRWRTEDIDGAVEIAKITAPYLHPRRASAPGTRAPREPDQMTDAELDAELTAAADPTTGAAAMRMASAPDDPDEPDRLG